MINTNNSLSDRIKQGDILSNVDCIEFVDEADGVITVSKIVFPLVIVLTQDCDLTWDFENRNRIAEPEKTEHDKYLFSVIVAPLYNYEHFITGTHLSDLNMKMQTISQNPNKTDNKMLRNNQNPRYHFLEFSDDVQIVNSVIDFKHYFSVNVCFLQNHKKNHYICSVSELFRERITQRFANFLSRIGLPDAKMGAES